MYDIYISTSYHCIWEFIRILRKISRRRTSINHVITVKRFGEKDPPDESAIVAYSDLNTFLCRNMPGLRCGYDTK